MEERRIKYSSMARRNKNKGRSYKKRWKKINGEKHISNAERNKRANTLCPNYLRSGGCVDIRTCIYLHCRPNIFNCVIHTSTIIIGKLGRLEFYTCNGEDFDIEQLINPNTRSYLHLPIERMKERFRFNAKIITTILKLGWKNMKDHIERHLLINEMNVMLKEITIIILNIHLMTYGPIEEDLSDIDDEGDIKVDSFLFIDSI